MTDDINNSLEELEQDDLGGASGTSSAGKQENAVTKNLAEAWRTQPLFKLLVIMIVVGAAIAGALGVFSGPPEAPVSKIVAAPGLNEPPGGKASPFFIEQNQQANAERADHAIQQGGSALPTPVGQNLDLSDLNSKPKEDPLAEFRAETERLKQEMTVERQQNAQQMQVIQQQIQQKPAEKDDDSLAQAMQRQMQQLMEAWAPRNIKVVEGMGSKERDRSSSVQTVSANSKAPSASPASVSSQVRQERYLVQAGTVNYAQMLTEANSDVPGPILAQVLSGPFAGGRAIGRFQTMRNFLIIQFNLINYKGKDYPVNILALDPNTTLGGMATEVDNRYFDRILLPAAANFTAQFGSTLGQGGSSMTITDNAIVVEHAKAGLEDAMFSGLGNAAQGVAQFLQQEASQIKPLIRVATGTPMGLFFLTSVKDDAGQEGVPYSPSAFGFQGANSGYTAIPGYGSYPSGTNQYSSSSNYGTRPVTMTNNPAFSGLPLANSQPRNSSINVISSGQVRY